MGIDIYARWKGQTDAELKAQAQAWHSIKDGSIGYLREAYHGEPYATQHLVAEAFELRYGALIGAATLRERLPETLRLAEERARKVYSATTAPFTVSAGGHTITFEADGSGEAAYLDDIKILGLPPEWVDDVTQDIVGDTVSGADGVPDRPSSSLRRSKMTYDYDEYGRQFASHTYGVNPSDGSLSTYTLNSSTWFDRRGNVIKSVQPGGLVNKTQYDGAGRSVATYQTDGGGDTVWGDADDVTGDYVLSQTEYEYDENGNAKLVTQKDHFHDDTLTGALGDSDSTPYARVSYVRNYYDVIDRLADTVNLGTYGGDPYTSGTDSVAPSASNDKLRTSYEYDAAGRLFKITDPKEIETRFAYDLLGRKTETIENYVNGTPSADDDRKTQYTYNGNGDVLTMKAVLPSSAFQETKYFYGLQRDVSSLTRSSTTATATVSRHGFQVGDKVIITGADDDDYNSTGTTTITAVTTDTFSYTVANSPDTPATGAIRVQQAVTSITRSSTTATVTISNHGFKVGQSVSISGADQPEYNGTFVITGISTHTFAYTVSGTPASGTGTMLARAASDVWSNDILVKVQYPDKSSGYASSAEQENITYNALNERTRYTDRNGTTHAYSYDVLGRVLSDDVTGHLGSGVDSAIARIDYSYNTQGLLEKITSSSASPSVVNEIKREYNGLGQLTKEYQDHSGSVGGSEPNVQYAYSEMSGGANHSRLTKITYPNGRIVRYEYGTSGNVVSDAVNDSISRLTFLADDSTGSIGTHLEDYEYLGLGAVVARVHPEPDGTVSGNSGVDLTYIDNSDTVYGDAGDQYEGLDRFGRIVDQRWINRDNSTDLDRWGYGYDENSNRLYKQNKVETTLSEAYTYDMLNRLTNFARGTLNVGKTAISANQSRELNWTLDALGNMDSVGGDISEDRTHNGQNQITGGVGTTPAYDANGSLTTNQDGLTYIYDAWNRLKQVKNGGTPVKTYVYDGVGRRINDGSALFYSDQWQVIQEGTGNGMRQQVWSPVYVDAMVLRDRDSDNNGSLNERLYALQDANFNTTALVNTSGAVVERYLYDPYGSPTVIDDDWSSDANGLSDVNWVYLHQGGRFDTDVYLYHFRGREVDPELGRPIQPDPLGYVDGMNRNQWEGNNPIRYVDPLGLERKRVEVDFAESTWQDRLWFWNTKWATSLDDLWAALDEAVGTTYDTTGQCGNCVDYLRIAGHGTPARMIFRNFDISQAELTHTNKANIDNREEAIKFLEGIEPSLCQNATVEFVTCQSGAGLDGIAFEQEMERILGANGKNIDVILYSNYCGIGFGGGVSTSNTPKDQKPDSNYSGDIGGDGPERWILIGASG